MKEMLLDNIDRQIIALLEADSKLNNKELASRIGLSVTPTFERVKRLERMGVIIGYKAVVNPKMVGKNLKVLCQVSLKSHFKEGIDDFEIAIQKLPEVSHCFHVAGIVDYILIVEVPDMNAYQEFLRKRLAQIPHIGQVNSSFVMAELK